MANTPDRSGSPDFSEDLATTQTVHESLLSSLQSATEEKKVQSVLLQTVVSKLEDIQKGNDARRRAMEQGSDAMIKVIEQGTDDITLKLQQLIDIVTKIKREGNDLQIVVLLVIYVHEILIRFVDR